MTLDEIFDTYKTERKDEVRESTMSAYYSNYSTHISPSLGSMSPEDLTSGILQEWIDGMEASPHSIRDRYTLLMGLLNWYCRKNSLPLKNFRVRRPREDRHEIETYTRAEQKKLVEYAMEHPGLKELGVILCLGTGLRIGELCGIQWKDIDLQKNEISINKTVERVYDVGHKHTRIVINPPKTESSRRIVPIPGRLKSILKGCSVIVKPDYFLLSGNEKPLEPRLYRNFYLDMLRKAGVRRLKFHGLRHSFATLMVESKADIKTISSILGHSGVEITMDIYVHPTIDSKREQMKKAFKGIL